MAEIEKYHDLCSTCNLASTCVRRKNQKGPIWYCEEFDVHVPPPVKKAGNYISQSEETKYDKSLGLCCNCANRDTCTLPKPDGGVWHCEEYC